MGGAQSVAWSLPGVPGPCRGSSVRVRLQMRMTHPDNLVFSASVPPPYHRLLAPKARSPPINLYAVQPVPTDATL